jgi:hypothetical protein
MTPNRCICQRNIELLHSGRSFRRLNRCHPKSTREIGSICARWVQPTEKPPAMKDLQMAVRGRMHYHRRWTAKLAENTTMNRIPVAIAILDVRDMQKLPVRS